MERHLFILAQSGEKRVKPANKTCLPQTRLASG